MIARLAQRAHVVHAPQHEIEHSGSYQLGAPARLPSIQCVAEFIGPGFTDEVCWRSSLTAAWFQDAWALPIDHAALAAIQAMKWGSLANEFEL